MRVTRAGIIEDGRAVALDFADGVRARFHAVWLRDNVLDAAARAPRSGQRLVSVLDLPERARLTEAEADGTAVAFAFAPDGRRLRFPAAWLHANRYDGTPQRPPGWTAPGITLWDAATLPTLPTATFDALRSDQRTLAAWLGAVRRYGVAHLSGLPCESGRVCDVAALFGYVRETNYGRFFDVRAEVDPDNLACTNRGLQAHTDNPYRDPVPTLQILACLDNDVAGGESIAVDGFMAATLLRAESADGFALLAGHCARFEYAGSRGVRLRSRRPMVELDPDGALRAVRCNNRSVAPLLDVPYERMEAYYAAYRRFVALIDSKDLAVRFRLAPSEAFLLDNTRVLHARTAFSSGGRRWLQGCYADKDGLLSTLAAIEEEMGTAV